MIRSRYMDEWVGLVVVASVIVFLGVALQAGVLRDWFKPVSTLRILLPEAGVAGLSVGADVEVLGTRAGRITRIVIDPSEQMHAEAEIDEQATAFIRRDSKAVIRQRFGIAGAAYVDIQRGTGPELDWSYAVIQAETERAPTETVGALIDEMRAKIFPVLDDAGRAMRSLAVTMERVERGEGNIGRLLSDETLVRNLEATAAEAQAAAADVRRIIAQLEPAVSGFKELADTVNAQEDGVPELLRRADRGADIAANVDAQPVAGGRADAADRPQRRERDREPPEPADSDAADSARARADSRATAPVPGCSAAATPRQPEPASDRLLADRGAAVRRLLLLLLLLVGLRRIGAGTRRDRPSTRHWSGTPRPGTSPSSWSTRRRPPPDTGRRWSGRRRATTSEQIGTLGYNLAVAELHANAPDRALAAAQTTRTELQRRGAEPFPALLLVEATALYRTGAPTEADAVAARPRPAPIPRPRRAPASCAASSPTNGATNAISQPRLGKLRTASDARPAGRCRRAGGAPGAAAGRFCQRHSRMRPGRKRCAARRSTIGGWRGSWPSVARPPAVAANAKAAAELFWRAGQSAAAQDDLEMARLWLRQAADLAPGMPVGKAANDLLAKLNRNE